jgi:hypothetical protein
MIHDLLLTECAGPVTVNNNMVKPVINPSIDSVQNCL